MRFSLVVTFVLLLHINALLSQSVSVPVNSERWQLINAERTEYLGREAIRGYAILNDIQFENGVVEYDIALDGSRSYPGITFRMQSMENFENFYIRPHASNWANALQYTPVINGVAGWQLYNGDGFSAMATIPANEWLHIKIEIKGEQARVFLKDMEKPVLNIHKLQHGNSKGWLAIKSSKFEKAYYSNFSYELTDTLEFSAPPNPVPPMGLIREWQISQSFSYNVHNHEKYPTDKFLSQVNWQNIETAKNGLVDVSRYSKRSTNGEPNFILAKTSIYAEKDEIREFAFGYSDIINIFINKQKIFSGNNSYRSRSAFFQGIVGLNDVVSLPLKKGENELLFYLAETFGGWGFMCQDASTEYIRKDIKKAWEIDEGIYFPESVVYDSKRNFLYISNYFNGGNEFISRLKPDGKIDQIAWVSGLSRPTGMTILKDKLFVVCRRTVVEIDPDSGKVLNNYAIPGAQFPNDITSDDEGNLYITDTRRNLIYILKNGVIEVWNENPELLNPNGLLFDNDKLLVGTSGDASLKYIDLKTKQIIKIAEFGSGSVMDGIQKFDTKHYLISDYNGRIFKLDLNSNNEEWINRTATSKFCADFAYVKKLNLLVVPSLYDNRISAFKIK